MQVDQYVHVGSRWELASRPRAQRCDRTCEASRASTSDRLRRAVDASFPFPGSYVIIEFGPAMRVTMGADAARHPGGFATGPSAIASRSPRTTAASAACRSTSRRRARGGCSVFRCRSCAAASSDSAICSAPKPTGSPSSSLRRPTGRSASIASRLSCCRGSPERASRTSRVDWAIGQIESGHGRIDVGALARELGCSHKHLIALFQDQVGIPPKLLASLVRFDAVVGAARMRSGDTWSALAITHGYFDQAHLARDVRRFAGLTPTEVRALAR
jgi:AraC-like DNA-binding protein